MQVAASAPPSDPLIDTVVGDRYRVVRKLGEGGMSIVYEAHHIKLMRSFALKALIPDLIGNQEVVDRFAREAELLGTLRHRNVVAISDWITLPNGSPCMVLEYLHGASLLVRLLRAPMSWVAIARIGDQVMSALVLSHRLGITHRDVKPENIFIAIDDSGDEQAKLLDFGISKLRGVGRLSGANKLLGTPAYMSPEQISGDTALIGPATDVWAMGAILYEMATQRVAYQGLDMMQTLELIKAGRPPPITSYRADAPAKFVDLIARAMALDPEQRIVTMEEFREGLRAALPREVTSQLAAPSLTPLSESLFADVGAEVLTPQPDGARSLSPTPDPPQRTAEPPSVPVIPAVIAPAGSSRRRWVIAIAAAAIVTLVNLVIALAL